MARRTAKKPVQKLKGSAILKVVLWTGTLSACSERVQSTKLKSETDAGTFLKVKLTQRFFIIPSNLNVLFPSLYVMINTRRSGEIVFNDLHRQKQFVRETRKRDELKVFVECFCFIILCIDNNRHRANLLC